MCEAKLAFFPTNTATLKRVIDKFLRLQETTYVLDPCCGAGEAVSVFRDYGSKLYGIEVDEERAKSASLKLDKTLNANAISGVNKSNEWAGVLFLNPPYGTSIMKERLEQEFVNRYGHCVVKGGAMILVINPSSATDKMAKAIKEFGYKPIASVFDPENSDYKNYKQFFIVLQRIDKKYRADPESLSAMFEPVPIDEAPDDLIEVSQGVPPKIFREYEVPDWKIDEMLKQSKLDKRFANLLATDVIGRVSIESPNEGQAALLLASGILNRPIGDWLMKGKVSKVATEVVDTDPETGVTTGVSIKDDYKVVRIGFNIRTLEFSRFE
jgi:predicted RNA methylase